MNISKIKSSILILTTTTISPELINIFITPLHPLQRTGFYLIALSAILYIFLQSTSEADKIDQILQVKKIEINGSIPKRIK